MIKTPAAFIALALAVAGCGKGLDTTSDDSLYDHYVFVALSATNSFYQYHLNTDTGELQFHKSYVSPSGYNQTSSIAVSPDAKYVLVTYGSPTNFGMETWKIDASTGTLSFVSNTATMTQSAFFAEFLPGAPTSTVFFQSYGSTNFIHGWTIDGSNGAIGASINALAGASSSLPGGVAVAPNANYLYTADASGLKAYAINPSTRHLSNTVALTALDTRGVDIHPSNLRGYGMGANGNLFVVSVTSTGDGNGTVASVPTHTSGRDVAVDRLGEFLVTAGIDTSVSSIKIHRLDGSGNITSMGGSNPFPGGGTGVVKAIFASDRFILAADAAASKLQAFLLDRSSGLVSSYSPISLPSGSSPLGLAVARVQKN
jgi:6-phosphogluconolactonase (cycloisomerase 2 family)